MIRERQPRPVRVIDINIDIRHGILYLVYRICSIYYSLHKVMKIINLVLEYFIDFFYSHRGVKTGGVTSYTSLIKIIMA